MKVEVRDEEDGRPEELTVFYNDDSGEIRGPYDASTILTWYTKGYFADEHLMRITDNGQRIGNKVNIEKTLGELKRMFGNDAPIPLTAECIPKTSFPSFSINPLSRCVPRNALKQITRREEPINVEERANFSRASIREPTTSNRTLSTEREVAGPALPPTKSNKKRKRSRSSSRSRSPPRRKQEERKRERSYSRNSLYSSDKWSDAGQKQESETRQKISTYRKNLPFYHGDRKKDYDRLKKSIIMELAKHLRLDFESLKKNHRNELFKNVAEWNIPERCEICDCPLMQPANFLSHVLSDNHIKKSVQKVHGKRKSRFTLETDYLPLRRELEAVKRIPMKSTSSSPKSQRSVTPTSREHPQLSKRERHRRESSQDSAYGPYRSGSPCRQS